MVSLESSCARTISSAFRICTTVQLTLDGSPPTHSTRGCNRKTTFSCVHYGRVEATGVKQATTAHPRKTKASLINDFSQLSGSSSASNSLRFARGEIATHV